ncbi:MAG: hypothetical protein ABI333_13520 [bacterium]
MRRRTAMLWLVVPTLFFGGLSLTGCKSIKEICRSTCKQQRECDPNFDEYYTTAECRQECEQYLEDYTEDVSDSCADAYLDLAYCQAHLSCDDLNTGNYSDCDDENRAVQDHCSGGVY